MNKKVLLVLIILVTITILIIGITLIYIKNNHKDNTQSIENNIIDNSKEVKIVQNSDKTKDFIETNTSNKKEKEYIELTESNYKEYSKNNYVFIIQDTIRNKDKTITLKGRVYKKIEMPDMLTKEQVDAISNGNALRILGEKVVRLENDNARNYGYDMTLIVESTKESKYKMIYYVKKNNDGTAKLSNGSEAFIADGTDIYMEITLKEKMICGYGTKRLELGQIYEKDYHIDDQERIRHINEDVANFYFSHGVCVSIDFSAIN